MIVVIDIFNYEEVETESVEEDTFEEVEEPDRSKELLKQVITIDGAIISI